MQMIVFGASNSDAGRAFNAPSAFQFEQYGIGPAPFKRLYEAPDSNVSFTSIPIAVFELHVPIDRC